MEDYEMLTRLGGGSFADVYKAREKSTGDIVAIKVLKKKYKKLEECNDLRECKSLQILNKISIYEKGFENIINLKKIIFTKKTGVLNLIFEYMEKDLLELMKSLEPKHLPEERIKDIVYQTLQGLAFMHKYGFFHRDIKPENILLLDDKVKIADFGLAREIRTLPPYTEYVSTRYYRAPECILKSTNYNSPIDIWALGCVMAEMYLHPQPLFYGANEKEVLYRICSILGSPDQDTWPEGMQLAHLKDIKFPYCYKSELKDIIKDASDDAIDLMEKMIRWDPKKRETAENLLRHKFFESYFYKDFNYNINFETNGSNDYFVKNHINNNIDTNMSNNNSISIILNKNISSQDNNLSDTKLNKNIFTNESSENFMSNKKENKNYEEKKESSNFSGYLNDTDGFNKLLNELKQEKMQEDKDFEKLEKQKQKNEYSNLWLSIEKKLDINANDNNKSVNKFINEIEEKETKESKEKEKEKFDLEDELLNTRIDNNSNNNTFLEKTKNEKKNSFLDELNFESNFKNEISNKDNNIKQKNDIINKPINLGLNLNNYNDKSDLDNLINKDNNEEFNFENAKRLKPIIKNNRRGSARKFLEESENKMKQNININQNTLENKEQISIGRRRIKYNFSNNVLPKINNDKKQIVKPTLIKNEFSFLDNNFNGNFYNQKKEEINSYNAFNKREMPYGNKIALTNNNLNLPLFLRDNKKDKFFEVKHNEQKNKPSFLLNKNIWDL